MSTVTSKDGTTIAYAKTGQGPAVILASGALSKGAEDAPLAERLAPHFTVFTYDRRGRGSSGDTAPYAVEREVEDFAAVLQAAGGSAYAFGSSSGGVLALEAASRLPAQVKKLAVFEPPFIVDDTRPRLPENFVARMAELAAAGQRGEAVEYFMTQGVGVPAEFVAQMRAAPMWPEMEALAHTLSYDGTLMGDTMSGRPLAVPRWTAADMPALVMDGGESPPWMRKGAAALAALLPNAQYRTLPGQMHNLDPDAVTPILVEFFSGRNA